MVPIPNDELKLVIERIRPIVTLLKKIGESKGWWSIIIGSVNRWMGGSVQDLLVGRLSLVSGWWPIGGWWFCNTPETRLHLSAGSCNQSTTNSKYWCKLKTANCNQITNCKLQTILVNILLVSLHR